MALLPILQYPDPRLYTKAVPIAVVNDEIRLLINNLSETMYAAPGVGLAATQVNDHRRVIVIDISETRDQLQVFVNPDIVRSSGTATCEEGCLSLPGIFEKVARAEQITVRARNARGDPFTLEAAGLLAVCIQHEIDHLEGKVFVDYLSRLKQQRILAKLKKQQRQAS
jgi:peptide deformylase